MNGSNIIYPSFESAQALFSGYSTISNNASLHKLLFKNIDSSFLSKFADTNTRELFNKILLKYYPNETCIKAEFINHILLKGKTHVGIFELPVGSSRADLCKINGTSIAYEIKTDLDNISRLNKQIKDYRYIFEQVYLICSSKKVVELEKLIPKECGIYTYHINRLGNYSFDLTRKGIHSNTINPKKQLQLLRKQEFCEYFCINRASFLKSVAITQVMKNYVPTAINEKFKIILKKRYLKQWAFLKENHTQILEIDYQWFFKNTINPPIIYS